MDPIVLKIIDLLRSGAENRALNQGGPTAGVGGMQLPQGVASMHGGQAPMDIVDQAVTGAGMPARDPMARSPRQ